MSSLMAGEQFELRPDQLEALDAIEGVRQDGATRMLLEMATCKMKSRIINN
jgi:hypothetical protein